MISELLTNSNWLQPQIDFLIFLQNLRAQTGDVFDQFFIALTKFGGELHFPTLFIAVIYWCISSKFGLFMFLVNGFTLTFSQLLKMTACIYRPWILNKTITPSALVIKSAGSYSFPSGHSMMAASTWGAMAYVFKNKKWLCFFLIFFTLLIGFSRLYLGVHTPQDVTIGLLTGVLFIFTIFPLINWCEKSKNRYIYLLLIINILLVAILVYILNKSYPIDYINGKILVDPRRGINISVVYFGWLFGLFNGAIFCRRFFPFNAKTGSIRTRFLRGIVGFITAYILSDIFQYVVFKERIVTDYKIVMPIAFLVTFYITAIYPWMFQKIKILRKYLYI